MVDAADERLEVPAIVEGRVGERHRQVRAAVERVLESDDAGATRRLLGQLDRVLHGLGAGVRVHDLVETLGQDVHELLGQVEHRL